MYVWTTAWFVKMELENISEMLLIWGKSRSSCQSGWLKKMVYANTHMHVFNHNHCSVMYASMNHNSSIITSGGHNTVMGMVLWYILANICCKTHYGISKGHKQRLLRNVISKYDEVWTVVQIHLKNEMWKWVLPHQERIRISVLITFVCMTTAVMLHLLIRCLV